MGDGAGARYLMPSASSHCGSCRPISPSSTHNFEGGAEAVTANYGASRLVIVENTTPQLATDNDARIQGTIRELREQGQTVPSAYRRVGNYSVFVFDAPDEQTAAQLIDGMSYEQTVQWLGDNPPLWSARRKAVHAKRLPASFSVCSKRRASRALLCLGIGGLFGGTLFPASPRAAGGVRQPIRTRAKCCVSTLTS